MRTTGSTSPRWKKLRKFTLDAKPVRWEALLPGHGAIALNKADLDIQKARDIVAADLAAGRELEGLSFWTAEYRNQMFGRPATVPARPKP